MSMDWIVSQSKKTEKIVVNLNAIFLISCQYAKSTLNTAPLNQMLLLSPLLFPQQPCARSPNHAPFMLNHDVKIFANLLLTN